MTKEDIKVFSMFILIAILIAILSIVLVKQEKQQERQQIETQTYIDDNQVYYIYLDKLGDVERVEVK